MLNVAAKSVAGSDNQISQSLKSLPHLDHNVGETERWLSAAAAGYLLMHGFGKSGPGPFSILAGGFLLYRATTGNCPLSQAMGCASGESCSSQSVIPAGEGSRVDQSIQIRKPVAEVYRYWRKLENLPRFMSHLEQVKETDGSHSHWVAKAPFGMHVEWDAEIISDKPNETISWKSSQESDVDTAGSVRFRSLDNGNATEVQVSMKYNPPAGRLGTALAKWQGRTPIIGRPSTQRAKRLFGLFDSFGNVPQDTRRIREIQYP
jgi:uncharacterized membrane protein